MMTSIISSLSTYFFSFRACFIRKKQRCYMKCEIWWRRCKKKVATWFLSSFVKFDKNEKFFHCFRLSEVEDCSLEGTHFRHWLTLDKRLIRFLVFAMTISNHINLDDDPCNLILSTCSSNFFFTFSMGFSADFFMMIMLLNFHLTLKLFFSFFLLSHRWWLSGKKYGKNYRFRISLWNFFFDILESFSLDDYESFSNSCKIH